jgi:hypothetical protein
LPFWPKILDTLKFVDLFLRDSRFINWLISLFRVHMLIISLYLAFKHTNQWWLNLGSDEYGKIWEFFLAICAKKNLHSFLLIPIFLWVFDSLPKQKYFWKARTWGYPKKICPIFYQHISSVQNGCEQVSFFSVTSFSPNSTST